MYGTSGITNTHEPVGRQAIVVGAGIGGLAAAAAVAGYFERVIVMERDDLSEAPMYRLGTPQARHAHGLLVGGQRALEELFPGLDKDFSRAGGVAIRINQDLREELPNRDPMPQRDFGEIGFSMSRPLIELTLRQRLSQQNNIMFLTGFRALDLLFDPNARRVYAVRCARVADDHLETFPADLIVDASGRGRLTVNLLRSIGLTWPDDTEIGVDIRYRTAIVDIPQKATPDWKVVLTHNSPPHSTRRAVLLPIERCRWIIGLSNGGDETCPDDWSEFLESLKGLTTRTIYDAVRNTKPKGELARFGFPANVRRHFEHIESFPDALFPIGDVLCRFNPVYGQGMTVAAKEAVLLRRLLAASVAMQDPLAGLSAVFLTEANSFIDTAWKMAAIPDLAFPDTHGDRPPDLNYSLQFTRALSRVAARDQAAQRVLLEVWHMIRPLSALNEPELKRQVEAEMAQVGQSAPS